MKTLIPLLLNSFRTWLRKPLRTSSPRKLRKTWYNQTRATDEEEEAIIVNSKTKMIAKVFRSDEETGKDVYTARSWLPFKWRGSVKKCTFEYIKLFVYSAQRELKTDCMVNSGLSRLSDQSEKTLVDTCITINYSCGKAVDNLWLLSRRSKCCCRENNSDKDLTYICQQYLQICVTFQWWIWQRNTHKKELKET